MGRGLRPVINVSWQDAVDYRNWLSLITGCKFRLPSEIEWEYACRAGSETLYYFGNDGKYLNKHAWFSNNALGKTHAVGQKKTNAWGLYDMYGNVWEWCSNPWHTYGKNSTASDSVLWDVRSSRVTCGGSWDNTARKCCSATRNEHAPAPGKDNIGFRCLQELSTSTFW